MEQKENTKESWDDEEEPLLNPRRKKIRKIGELQKEKVNDEEGSSDKPS